MAPPRLSESPSFFRALGALGFFGVVAMALTDVLGILARPHYDPLSDTISLLAHHRLTGPQDIGLFLLAVGSASGGLGVLLWRRLGPLRVLIAFLMLIAGLAIVALTVSDVRTVHHPLAMQIHVDASLSVGAAVLLASVLFALALPRQRRGYRSYSAICAVVLVALAALYFVIPSGYVGLYERVLVADGMAWLGMISFALARGEPLTPRAE